MNRLLTIAAALASGWFVLGAATTRGDSPEQSRSVVGSPDWPLERVELLDGKTYKGFIESGDMKSGEGGWIHLIQVRRPPGRPMYLVIRPVERAAIAKVVRLQPDERALLRQRIDRFRNRAGRSFPG